ncbi:MAG TPA: hypothetical protein EYG03_07400 [Planctomycetes bacterium]|nr:hypothetical protein [Fuerstiella sp.]HIK91792.1 hypothetical protein [Planctomycetota bacterium]
MGKSRLSKRREVEAAEAAEKTAVKKKKTTKKKATKKKATKKKATTTRARKKKADTPARRRIVWVLYSSTMREEGRYLYHERDKAEEKLQALLAKGKRRYFLQPIKEPLDSEGNPMVPDEEEPVKPVKAVVATPESEEASEDEGTETAEAAGTEEE